MTAQLRDCSQPSGVTAQLRDCSDTNKPWAFDTATQFTRLWVGDHAATGDSAAWTGQIVFQHSVEFGTL